MYTNISNKFKHNMKLAIIIALLIAIIFVKNMTPIQYEVYGTMRCPYTVKMLKHLDDVNKPYVYHDVNEKRELFEMTKKKLGVTEKGVPFVVDKLNSTHFIGYREIS